MVTDTITPKSTPWTTARRKKVTYRDRASAYIQGFYASVEINEYSRRWSLVGYLGEHTASVSGELPDGATIRDLQQAAADAVPAAIAAGMTGR